MLFWAGSGSCDSLVVGPQSWAGNLGAALHLTAPLDLSTYTLTFQTDIPLTNIVV